MFSRKQQPTSTPSLQDRVTRADAGRTSSQQNQRAQRDSVLKQSAVVYARQVLQDTQIRDLQEVKPTSFFGPRPHHLAVNKEDNKAYEFEYQGQRFHLQLGMFSNSFRSAWQWNLHICYGGTASLINELADLEQPLTSIERLAELDAPYSQLAV